MEGSYGFVSELLGTQLFHVLEKIKIKRVTATFDIFSN